MSDNFDDLPIVDSHIHLFNLGFVPIAGIINSRKVPAWLAGWLARLFENRIVRTVAEPVARMRGLNRALESPTITARALPQDAGLQHDALEELIIAFVKTDPNAMPAARAAAGEVPRTVERKMADVPLPPRAQNAGLTAEQTVLAQLMFAASRYMATDNLVEEVTSFWSWLMFLLNHESFLHARFEEIYAIRQQKGLAIHHMMDMDEHYLVRDSLYHFTTEQIQRTQQLVQASEGALLAFVAYGPFRQNSLPIIKRAIGAGFAGVKFYPPNGYRPTDNTDAETITVPGKTVDERNEALYTYCVAEDIPLFTHCTPSGMESRPDESGLFSDPKKWRVVLHRHPQLRLGLGHAGGEESWMTGVIPGSGSDLSAAYVKEVIDLCITHEHVYCEFGHFHDILLPAKAEKFQKGLELIVDQHGDAFADKMMYGSDWHMLARYAGHEEYLKIMRDLFARSDILRPHTKKFFVTNALRYLNLPGYMARNQATLSPAAKAYLAQLNAFT